MPELYFIEQNSEFYMMARDNSNYWACYTCERSNIGKEFPTADPHMWADLTDEERMTVAETWLHKYALIEDSGSFYVDCEKSGYSGVSTYEESLSYDKPPNIVWAKITYESRIFSTFKNGKLSNMHYYVLCSDLGFKPYTNFVIVMNDGSISFTSGEPSEVIALYDAVMKNGYIPSQTLISVVRALKGGNSC